MPVWFFPRWERKRRRIRAVPSVFVGSRQHLIWPTLPTCRRCNWCGELAEPTLLICPVCRSPLVATTTPLRPAGSCPRCHRGAGAHRARAQARPVARLSRTSVYAGRATARAGDDIAVKLNRQITNSPAVARCRTSIALCELDYLAKTPTQPFDAGGRHRHATRGRKCRNGNSGRSSTRA